MADTDPELFGTLSDEGNSPDNARPAEEDGAAGTPAHVDELDDLEDLDDDDLFGDGGDDDVEPEQADERKLDDEELDSGDDEDRTDRAGRDEHTVQQVLNFLDADVARHAIPEPSDGELYLLKVPAFMAIEPTAFNHLTFQPPTTDHHSKLPPSDHFSPFNTAMTTVRWRRSPSDRSTLQSNARILRWSDGSLTMQHANDPLNQSVIDAGMLAPPQDFNSTMPTPTMVKGKRREDQKKESYTYLTADCEEARVMRVTNELTTYLTVMPTANTKDAALEKLQNDLAAAAARGRDSADQAISFIQVNEDPELHRQREELNHKEKLKQQRAREKHMLKEQERHVRVNGKSHRAGHGLDIDTLEGREGGRRGGPRKPRTQARRDGDWSEDEDFGPQRGNREDEYDEDDDFIARSDEEPEIVDDDDDEEEELMDEPRSRKTTSPKRNRRTDDDDEDEDEDEEIVVRSKKRRVVVDEDSDEE